MKRLNLSLLALVFCLILKGQDSDTINYQTIVRNSAGELLRSQELSFKLSILSGNTTGPVVYSEKHIVNTNDSGIVSIAIGKGMEKSGNFATIDWNTGNYFLKIEKSYPGEANYTDMAILQLLRVTDVANTLRANDSESPLIEDEIFIIRKYAGKYIDYRHTGPDTYNGPNIIWIKTSLDNIYGKISAYGRECDFSVGDNLYIKRTYYAPGVVTGYWIYQIENDFGIYYTATDFQYDRKVLLESWF